MAEDTQMTKKQLKKRETRRKMARESRRINRQRKKHVSKILKHRKRMAKKAIVKKV